MLAPREFEALRKVLPDRNSKLFSEFLPQGYEATTLDSVDSKERVVGIKVILGSLITLYDDHADRPDKINPVLLSKLYQLPFNSDFAPPSRLGPEIEAEAVTLASELLAKLFSNLRRLKHWGTLGRFFEFDLKQFFLANHYSELTTLTPSAVNSAENRLYLHHNMGIVMAGMIDLMDSPELDLDELGRARWLFLLGQRAGRISNVLTTIEREKKEGDVSNEILLNQNVSEYGTGFKKLNTELRSIFREMRRFPSLNTFSVAKYCSGFQKLHTLHLDMKGII